MSRLETTHTSPPDTSPAPPATPPRPVLAWLAVAVLVASAVVGSNLFAVRDRLLGTATPDAAPPAVSRTAETPTQGTVAAAPTSLRSQPWWQDVTVLEGAGTTTSSPFTITPGAVQWRVTWTCQTGRLQVRLPKQTRPVVDGACTAGGVGYAALSGQLAVQVTADGPWRMQVAQQIDAPLVEPPLPAMTAAGAAPVASGTLYNIDKTGTGKVTLYRQADGKYAIRLEDFFVSPTADLELKLSTLETPRNSEEFANAPSEFVARMDITAGSLNYAVPAGVDPTRFRSVVVWCAPIDSAYAAATLGPVR